MANNSYEDASASASELFRRIIQVSNHVMAVGVSSNKENGFGVVLYVNAPIPNGPNYVRSVIRNWESENGFPLTTEIHPGRVKAGGRVSFATVNAQTYRPVLFGTQIQNFDNDKRLQIFKKGKINVGTLGCFVRLKDGSIAILSNNHVIAGENEGELGKDKIVQPGFDFYDSSNQIAMLNDFEEIKFNHALGTVNEIDAAVAVIEITETKISQKHPEYSHSFGGLKTARDPSPEDSGRKVYKVGQRTGLTNGLISNIGISLNIEYQNRKMARFRNMFAINNPGGRNFCMKGDSGAVVFDDEGTVYGLIVATYGEYAFACPIESIMKRFSCVLYQE